MPIYEYRCGACGLLFDELVPAGDGGSTPPCTSCGSTDVRRMISLIGGLGAAASGAPARAGCGCGGACACGR